VEIGARRRFYIRGLWIRGVICRDCNGGLDQQVALPILGRVLGGSLEARPSFGLFFFVGCASGVPWRVLCKVLWGSGYTLPERLEVGR
jgi:hypothetical protein